MSKPNNILVVRLSSLGDVLMSVPAVIAVKNHFSGSKISWLAEGSVAEFLSYQDFIYKVIMFPRKQTVLALKKGDLSGAWRLLKLFVKDLRDISYDLILDFHGIIKSVVLSKIARGERLIGFGSLYAKEGSHLFYDERVESGDKRIHKVERNMLIARYLGCPNQIPDTEFQAPAKAYEYIDRFLGDAKISSNAIAINPFSSQGSQFKRWGLANFSQLARRIKSETGADIIILWGPGEQEEAQMLANDIGNGVFLACPTDIPQLFALLKRVRMYISGDTGVMHLAVAAKTPVVSIFGPTDYKVNAPYSTSSITLRKDAPCSPCKKKDCNDRICLENITVDEVFNAAQNVYRKVK